MLHLQCAHSWLARLSYTTSSSHPCILSPLLLTSCYHHYCTTHITMEVIYDTCKLDIEKLEEGSAKCQQPYKMSKSCEVCLRQEKLRALTYVILVWCTNIGKKFVAWKKLQKSFNTSSPDGGNSRICLHYREACRQAFMIDHLVLHDVEI